WTPATAVRSRAIAARTMNTSATAGTMTRAVARSARTGGRLRVVGATDGHLTVGVDELGVGHPDRRRRDSADERESQRRNRARQRDRRGGTRAEDRRIGSVDRHGAGPHPLTAEHVEQSDPAVTLRGGGVGG